MKTIKNNILKLLISISLLLSVQFSIAATSTFTAVQDGPWDDPATWGETTNTPSSGDIVYINYTVTVDALSLRDGEIYIDGGNLTISGDLDLKGNTYFEITNGGILNIGGDMSNGGSVIFNIIDGSIDIAGNFENSGSAELAVGESGSMDVGLDFSNTGSGDIVVDGAISVAGDLENKNPSKITGTGTLIVDGTITDYGGIGGNLLSPSFHAINNGDWNTLGVWSDTQGGASCNCIPSSSKDVVTIDGFTVDIATTAEVGEITVSETATLNIQAGFSLVVNGTTSINGSFNLLTNTITASAFINKGNITYGLNSKVKTRLALKANEFNYISSCYLNSPTDSINYARGALNPNVYNYNETVADHWGTDGDDDGDDSNNFSGWVAPTTEMGTAQGFAVYVPYIYYVELSGDEFLTGNLTKDITNTDTGNPNYDGWNLIGNPYPSGLDLHQFITDNVDPVNFNPLNFDGNAYVWDDDNTSGSDYASLDYIQINLIDVIGGNGSTFSGHLQANQGFFIKATDPNNTVVFNDAMRSTGTTTLVTAKSGTKNGTVERFKFFVESENKKIYNESSIGFIENATEGVDFGYDGLKKKGNPSIALYSLINENHYGIQGLAPIIEETEVELGLDLSTGGNYTFNVKENSLNPNITVFLKDKELNTEVEVSKNKSYNFTEIKGSSTNRFTLVFKTTNVTTAVEDRINTNEYTVYANKRTLFVNTNNENIEVSVSNLLGQKLSQHYLSNNLKTIQLPEANQVYLIRIKNEQNQISTYKVISK